MVNQRKKNSQFAYTNEGYNITNVLYYNVHTQGKFITKDIPRILVLQITNGKPQVSFRYE